MAKGDHLYVSRGAYFHHGIDCGDGTVIHYREGEAITRSAFPTFALGETVHVKPYPVSDPANVVVARAESRLGERDYHLVFNNCEHFVNWCKTGQHRSDQVNTVVAATAAGGLVGGVLLGGVFAVPAIAAAGIYGLSQQIEKARAAQDPYLAQQYLDAAWAELEALEQDYQQRIDQCHREVEVWERTARLALERDREDLARAALERKYPLGQQLSKLQQQQDEVLALRQTIRLNVARIQASS